MDGCTLWHRDGLHVWADWGEDGRLVIQGQALGRGLGGATEYEYGITVHPADVPRLVAALGLESADDVMEFLEANGFVVARAIDHAYLMRADLGGLLPTLAEAGSSIRRRLGQRAHPSPATFGRP